MAVTKVNTCIIITKQMFVVVVVIVVLKLCEQIMKAKEFTYHLILPCGTHVDLGLNCFC